ncbi:M12 family metallopeptidase [Pedobacter sp. NJ-S-72]
MATQLDLVMSKPEQTGINQYVIINEDNITNGNEYNFEIKEGSFDFGSIMMYDSYEFSKNGDLTITKLDGTTFTKQRNGLSAKDIAGVNILYP